MWQQEPSWEGKAGSIFDQVDTNADGKLTEGEFAAWAEKHVDQAFEFLDTLCDADFNAAGDPLRSLLNQLVCLLSS